MCDIVHSLAHGLFHIFCTMIEEYNEKDAHDASLAAKEEKGFIWISQNARELERMVIESIEKGIPIPEYLYNKNPKQIHELLKKWSRLDLVPSNRPGYITSHEDVGNELKK